MRKAPIPQDEDKRIAELRKYSILDTPPEENFDEITRLAASICGTRIALVSLVDSDRQWFKSRFGLDALETPRDISYCGHAILDDEIMMVEDSALDERFCDNPLSLGGPKVRFYAGVPLITPAGSRIGTLCVIDPENKILTGNQKTVLKSLAKHVVDILELKLKNEELSRATYQYREVQKITKTGGWEVINSCPLKRFLSDEVYEIYGIQKDDNLADNDFLALHLPRDKQRLADLEAQAFINGKGFEGEFELISGKWVNIIARTVCDETGKVSRLIGTLQDISQSKSNQAELMAGKVELDSYARGLNQYAIITKTDLKGRITYANDPFFKISGYSKEEVIGKDHRILNSGFHPKSFFKTLWEKVLHGETWRGVIQNKAKDGNLYWVDTIITPSMNATGEPTGFIAFRYDITERKEVEERLRESEIRHRLLFDQSVDAVMTLSPPYWNFTSANPATLKLFKVATQHEFCALGLWDLSPEVQPSGRKSANVGRELLQVALLKGSAYAEWTHQRHDGSTFPCTVLLSRIKQGEQTFLHAIVRDISEQKKIENELLESKQQLLKSNQYLSLALEGSDLGIWDWHLTNNAVFFDRRWAEMLGLKHDEISMELSTWESRVHPDDLAKCYEDIKAYLDGKTLQYENIHRMKHTDGHWVYILDRGKFSSWDENGKPIRFTGTHLNLTEHKKLENQLIEAQAISKTGSWTMNLSTMEHTWSLELYKIMEIKETSAKETLLQKYRDIIHPDDLPELLSIWKRVKEEGGDFVFDHSIVLENGKRIKHVQAIGKVSQHLNGKPHIISGTCRDITSEVLLERNLQNERAKTLHNAKLASIGHLAAGVGHEINNPLAIITGYLSLAEDSILSSPTPQPELLDFLQKIQKAGARIGNIVKGLRTFARSDDNQIVKFDVFDLLVETVAMLKDIYKSQGVELQFSGVKTNSSLFGNRGRIQQVLVNLISNAKDATEGRNERKIDIQVSYRSDSLDISVIDNGCGIPDDMKAKIFEPFFTTKDVNKGTGIGLSLVSTIVKEHEGRIELRSQQGVGTEFIISLPVDYTFAQASPGPEAQVLTLEIADQLRILVVDDEVELCRILGSMLTRRGAMVITVHTAKEALDLLESKEFDLVLSDIKMPKIDGFKFLQLLRENKKISQPKFLFLSGGVDMNSEHEQMIELQSDGLLLKPFDPDTLLLKISSIFPNKIKKHKQCA